MTSSRSILAWRKSRHSGSPDCVEVANVTNIVAVRDSKLDTTGEFPMLTLMREDWAGVLADVRTGGFSH